MNASVVVVIAILAVLGWIVAPVLLIWGWVRWVRQPKKWIFTSILSTVGFLLASASALVAVSMMAYARFIHSFGYYDPSLLRIFRIGIFLSLAGTASGLGGVWRPNSLRWHSPASAVATLAFWFLAAEGE